MIIETNLADLFRLALFGRFLPRFFLEFDFLCFGLASIFYPCPFIWRYVRRFFSWTDFYASIFILGNFRNFRNPSSHVGLRGAPKPSESVEWGGFV
jgi:hypothetical protein